MVTFPFVRNLQKAMQFSPVLDGVSYNAVVTWNFAALRYYVNLYQLDGVRVCAVPMIGSPDSSDLNILSGFFTTKLVYRASQSRFEVI